MDYRRGCIFLEGGRYDDRRFRRRGRATFEDRYGNQLTVKRRGHEVAIFIYNRRGFTDVYFKVNDRNQCGHNNNYKSRIRRGHHDRGQSYRSQDLRSRQGVDGYQDFGEDRSTSRFDFELEGTYQAEDGRIIAIVETRDGFRAKFSGDKIWKDYKQEGNRYQDVDGNTYELQQDLTLMWKGRYSGKSIIVRKISDEVRY